MSNRAINKRAYSVACERQKICVERLCSRVTPRNTSEKANILISRFTRGQLSPLDAQRSARSYPKRVSTTLSLAQNDAPTDAASPSAPRVQPRCMRVLRWPRGAMPVGAATSQRRRSAIAAPSQRQQEAVVFYT